MKAIYEKDLLYTVLRPYVDWCCRHSYRRFEIHGKENIPSDGALIIAPNHCNTLMDALVMLRAHKGSTVFGARADLFKKQSIARIMHFLRILPMVRQRDGLRNVLKNHESIQTITDTLEHGVRFCIFPEGRHRTMHSLLPFGKGVFRAALSANARFGHEKPVYIVPAGIEYGDYFRYRSTCLITYGKALNVTEFVRNAETENEAQLIEQLRQELASRMSGLITCIKDDSSYRGKWELTKMLARRNKYRGLHGKMALNMGIIAGIEQACISNPAKTEALLKRAEEFGESMDRMNLSSYSFGKKNPAVSAILKGTAAIAMFPYFIFCSAASLPMWAMFSFLKKKIKDKAFSNTAGFGIKLAMGPLVFALWTALAFCFLPWQCGLAVSLLTIPSYSFFYDYTEFIRRFISDIRVLGKKEMRREYEEICTLAENMPTKISSAE